MAELCEQAETLLKQKNIRLSANKRAALATYDAETQVRWIVNPLMEWILQGVTNQILAGRQVSSSQLETHSAPAPVSKPAPVVEPVGDDDDIGFGLFD